MNRRAEFMAIKSLSGLLDHALADLAACDASGHYVRHDGQTHFPVGDKTHIGLTGAVLAITFGANRKRRIYGFNVDDRAAELRLDAIGFLESGHISSAYSAMARTCEADVPLGDYQSANRIHVLTQRGAAKVPPRFSCGERWDRYAVWCKSKLVESGL